MKGMYMQFYVMMVIVGYYSCILSVVMVFVRYYSCILYVMIILIIHYTSIFPPR